MVKQSFVPRKMAAGRRYFVVSLLIFFLISVCCLPEPGKKDLHFKKNQTFDIFTKTMNKGYSVAIKGSCNGVKKIDIYWRLYVSQCAESFSFLKTSDQNELQSLWISEAEQLLAYSLTAKADGVVCNNRIHLKDVTDTVKELIISTPTEESAKESKPDDTEKAPPTKETSSDAGDGKPTKKSQEKSAKTQTLEDSKRAKDQTSKHERRRRKEENGDNDNTVDKDDKGTADPEVKKLLGDTTLTAPKEEEDPAASPSEAPETETKPGEKTTSDAKNAPETETKPGEKTTSDAKNAPETETKPGKKTTSDAENASNLAPEDKGKKASSNAKHETYVKAASSTDWAVVICHYFNPICYQRKLPDFVSSKVFETKAMTSDKSKVKNKVCATKRDGVFLLMVSAKPSGAEKDKDFELTLNVEMKGPHGYLSASDWPLYPFYGCMSLLYVFYGILWLIVSACQWRDLLRIQFWIGGVIALGMLEKAVFFSEYNNINITGETNPSLTVFAELVSCVKRTLARILVIIVSMGFGIVKPRLGNTLHRVLGVGALYFILATIEGCFRSLHPKSDPGKQQLIASIPLAVLDASICWWIFMSLVQTTRTLRIRRNLVKLSLYRHFTNTLVFAVLASVAYMIWSIKTHRFAKNGCITDWSELWLDEAFWHFLFSIVLLVIMILWRPTANNQRYAFTPIVDFGDDDDDDENMTLSDAFDGMKMRNVKNTPEVMINGDSKRKHKPEDDLKWVEENIPSSAADAVLPSVLDSDEELMTTKFEMSKME